MVEGWQDDQVDVTFARKAVAFVEEHVKERPEQPFFLYLTPSAPHRPCVPPRFVQGKSQAGLRGDSVVLVDWMVGEVLKVLKRLEVEENTLMLFTSDNGGRLTDFYGLDWGHKANGDLRGQKGDIFDGGHREPLVAMWPDRIKPQSTSDELVCLMDLMATCAAIVGEDLPAGAAEDSRNILPALLGGPLSEPGR